jgi:hypothetical protein
MPLSFSWRVLNYEENLKWGESPLLALKMMRALEKEYKWHLGSESSPHWWPARKWRL